MPDYYPVDLAGTPAVIEDDIIVVSPVGMVDVPLVLACLELAKKLSAAKGQVFFLCDLARAEGITGAARRVSALHTASFVVAGSAMYGTSVLMRMALTLLSRGHELLLPKSRRGRMICAGSESQARSWIAELRL